MFRKKSIENFLAKVVSKEPVAIYPSVHFTKLDNDDVPCEILIEKSLEENLIICFIDINRRHFQYEKNSNLLKAYLLHEIGHCYTESRLKYENELLAHLWAIQKAKQLNLPKVVYWLENIIKSWSEIPWNEYPFRRYIIASKIFNKMLDSDKEIIYI